MHSDYSHQRQDPIANAIVSQYSWYTLVALHSTGNGDCLFNSFSLCLAGDESRDIELRYRCCIEMTTNRARMLRHRLYRALEPVSPDFDTDCLKCAQKGQYASMWNILALANLQKVKVTVVYPTVNGSETYIFKNLNQKTATKWKIQDMPNFIEKLYSIVKGDEEERCRAIRQAGSYRLDDRYKHHEMGNFVCRGPAETNKTFLDGHWQSK